MGLARSKSVINMSEVTEEEKYQAAMVLSACGDALGFKNGHWEFCHSGKIIHKELEELGGVKNIKLNAKDWRVSDDTVLNIATAEALVEFGTENDKEKLYCKIAEKYKEGMRDMTFRSPGLTTSGAVHMLRPAIDKGYQIPFNPRGGGCGAAMRAQCIGLRYPRPEQLDDLIAVSIESGRMTHHHPTGYLGSLVSALFTSYALQGKETKTWGNNLMKTLEKAMKYIEDRKIFVEENRTAWNYFQDSWINYLSERGITDGNSDPVFPENYDIVKRDKTYKRWSYKGWGGASGHDAPMIAYDAVLGSGNSWKELCDRSMFHGGDSDSTGVIAACWFGAMYGFYGVQKSLYDNLEYKDRITSLADKLFLLNKS